MATSLKNIIFLSPVVTVIFFFIFLDFIDPRYALGEKFLKGLFLIFIGTVILSMNHIKLSTISFLTAVFFSYCLINGFARGESLRDIGAGVVLYITPFLLYLYFNTNVSLTKKLIAQLEHIIPIFIFFIIIAFIFSLLTEERRFEVRNPILFMSLAIVFLRKFNLGYFVLLFVLFSLILLSSVRLSLALLLFSLVIAYFYLIRSSQTQNYQSSFLIILLSFFLFVILLSNVDFSETRFRTLLDIRAINVNELLANNEYSALTRYFEYEAVMAQIENEAYYQNFFGHGFGATYAASDNLLTITSISGGSYQDSVIRDTGVLHNIHFGPLSIFFRFGYFGLALYSYLVFKVIIDILSFTQKNDGLFVIKSSMLFLLIQDLFYSQVQSSISYLIIPLYFASLNFNKPFSRKESKKNTYTLLYKE
tara:strand:+ start:1289 stop:2551 length:1263 start_codon:yes stop_codon:yes gene_type:complete